MATETSAAEKPTLKEKASVEFRRFLAIFLYLWVGVVLVVFHFIESAAVGLFHGHTIAESLPPFLGWNPRGLLAVGVMCFIVLLPFFGFRELARVIGHKEMRALILEREGSDPSLSLLGRQ